MDFTVVENKNIIKNNNESIKEKLLEDKREGMEDFVKYLEDKGYFTCPAAARHHCNYEGGLVDHSMNLYNLYVKLMSEFDIEDYRDDECNLFLAAICHDLCKCGLYIKKETGGYKSNQFVYRAGHAKLSLKRLNEFIKLTSLEEQMVKYHMGMYGTKEFLGDWLGEYTIKELVKAFNDKRVKLFYFCDDMVSQFVDKKAEEIENVHG